MNHPSVTPFGAAITGLRRARLPMPPDQEVAHATLFADVHDALLAAHADAFANQHGVALHVPTGKVDE